MNYSELLSEYIKDSGLSLGEIAKRMTEEKNMKIDRSYISMLKNGKTKNPASEEINRALAEVTGGDPDRLIMAAYIERAPKEVQAYIQNYAEHIDSYTKMVAALFANSELKEDEYVKEVERIYESLKQMPIEQRFDFIMHRFNSAAIADNSFLRTIGEVTGVDKERIDNTLDTIREKPLNRIEVWDMVRDKRDIEWVPATKIHDGSYVYVIAGDESMSGANIHKGSKVLVKLIHEEDDPEHDTVESGKIYLVGLNEEDVGFRRVFKEEGQPILLQAENPKFPPIMIHNDSDFDVFGKVVSVEFNPNQD
jgi:transcriptional regulator with XRE-family HTH domain